MQGIESLDKFKNFVSSLGGLGRFEDTYIVHAAEGETVVPMEVLDRNPALKKRLFKTMVDMGIEPGRYIVGNELNSRNPVTGQPEFFLKKIVSQIRKALPGDSERFLGTAVGLATGNPFLGAIAGGIGSGMEGAISGGLTGYRSPGIEGLGGGFGRRILGEGFGGSGKVKEMGLGQIFGEGGLRQFLAGADDQSGLIGRGGKFFDFSRETPAQKAKKIQDIVDAADITDPDIKAELIKDLFAASNKKSLIDIGVEYGIPFLTLAEFLKSGESDDDVGVSQYQYTPTGEEFEGGVFAAKGGIMDLRSGGMSLGPGTETSDDIPAMLSDGEFVMTAKAVRGAGGGDRREGAKRMYEAMDKLEAQA